MSSVILHNGTVPVSNGRALSNDAFVADVNDITGESDKTPSEVASTLSDINSALGAAITAKGGTVTSGSTLSDKAEEVGSIPGGGGDPYEKVWDIMTGNITYIKTRLTGQPPWVCNNNIAGGKENLAYVSMRNAQGRQGYDDRDLPNGFAFGARLLKIAIIGTKIGALGQNTFSDARHLETVVLTKKSVIRAANNSFGNSVWPTPVFNGFGIIYVPDLDFDGNDLPSQYKVETNYTSFVNQIYGYSEAPEYSESVEYGIGNVCKYNNKFYAYCKENLQPTTSNAPSGTNEDNECWEWIDNIEVSA